MVFEIKRFEIFTKIEIIFGLRCFFMNMPVKKSVFRKSHGQALRLEKLKGGKKWEISILVNFTTKVTAK